MPTVYTYSTGGEEQHEYGVSYPYTQVGIFLRAHIRKRSLLKSDQKEVKRLLERLASQELEHKQRVEFLYTEVAFPQTNSG